MAVFAIGDSRVRQFSKIPDAILREAAGQTMLMIALSGSLNLHGIEGPADAIFCFGEIDARVHFAKYHQQNPQQNRTMEELIGWVVNRYLTAVHQFCIAHYLTGYVCGVIGPIDLATANPNAEIPVDGSLAQRAERVWLANRALAAGCQSLGLTYFDPQQRFCDGPCDSLNPKFSDGIVHLADHLQDQVAADFLRHKQFRESAILPEPGEASANSG